ncbi:MAG: hypothetical protein J6333_09210, partial [Planctomycetes bacterium]|nr:hypothetical protein [Planctomycetota bacterium]
LAPEPPAAPAAKEAPAAAPTPEEILAQADADEANAAPAPDKEPDPDSPEGKLARAKQLLGDLGNLEFLDISDFTDDDTLDGAAEEALAEPEPEPEPEPAPGAPVAPVPEEDMRAAYAIAVEQKKILIARHDATPAAIAACAKCCENEPLYQAMRRHGLDPVPVFGWGTLMLAMREYGEMQAAKLKAIRKEMADLAGAKSSGGFLGFGGKKGDAEQRLETLKAAEKTRLQAIADIGRDAQASEAEMVGAFWDVYRQLALKYVAGMDGKDAVFARAFLRWGALGMSSRWLLPGQMRAIVNDCFPAPTAPDYSLKATSLYYADEIILYTARGQLPPSPNEDLELNHRNSPEWKADRAWRRMVNCMGYNVALKELLKEQLGQAGVLRRQAEEIEELLGKKRRPPRGNAKEALDQLKDKAQRLRVAAHRYESNAERLETNLIPRNDDAIESSRDALRELDVTVTPEALAEHEILCLRRYSRLVAKLKEPFLPFALRDHFKPEIKCVNLRPQALEMLADAEKRDPGLFLEPLVPGARREHQLYVRRTPMIILAPAGGILGFVAGPRSGNESGRFILPSYVERAAMREEILWRTLSDFRYDTSKAAAGVDLMTSDTLVAAYATLRWNLRKRDRELRQKAGIYTEENERTNFRRHYAIYMKSALDSGKLLFFRCPELYELIIPKYIQLPQGCEILRR